MLTFSLDILGGQAIAQGDPRLQLGRVLRQEEAKPATGLRGGGSSR